METCRVRKELTATANTVLGDIADLSRRQIEALRAGDLNLLQRLDLQMERKFGEKERAFGALHEHTREHGC